MRDYRLALQCGIDLPVPECQIVLHQPRAEEIGLIGITIFCLTYAWLIWKTGSIASLAEKSKQYFSYYVANGILFMFASQLTIHILVNLGLLPNKGLTLPLISYGGSSLFVSMFSIAILLRIDYENRRQLLGGYR